MSVNCAERLRSICLSLPEATVQPVEGEKHLIFVVRKRTFAYFLENHHGDGETALTCKVDPGMNESLVQAAPARFFIPSYLGHRGWISVRLDHRDTDWKEIADLVEMSYRHVAPRTLTRRIT